MFLGIHLQYDNDNEGAFSLFRLYTRKRNYYTVTFSCFGVKTVNMIVFRV